MLAHGFVSLVAYVTVAMMGGGGGGEGGGETVPAWSVGGKALHSPLPTF